METINKTVEVSISELASKATEIFEPLNYKVVYTEEDSIMIEAEDEDTESLYLFNVNSYDENKNHRQRFIILTATGTKIKTRITYYNVDKACIDFLEKAVELAASGILSKYN